VKYCPLATNHDPLRTDPWPLIFLNLSLELGGFREAEVALGQRQCEELLDLGFFAVAGHGQFADQEVAGALKHFLFAEGKRLRLMEGDETLQNTGDFEQRSGAHAV
jgi:hypothetical protein